MTGVVLVSPRTKFTDSSGTPIAGGSVTVYLAGTTTLATTYQDKTLLTENTNPITLDANGECLLWADSGNTYKILLEDSNGATVSGYPVDNIPGAADVGAAAVAAAAAAAPYVTAAQLAENNAETAQAAAESARDAAIIGAGVYVDEPTGRAAVANGVAFKVQGSGNVAAYEYRRVDALSSTLIATYPSYAYVDDTYYDRLFSAQAKYFNERRLQVKEAGSKRAAIIIPLGQSNNTGGVNDSTISGSPSPNAYMPAGGPYLGYYSFYAGNNQHPTHWTDVGTVTAYAEGVSEGPCGGLIVALEGLFPRMYVASAAMGGQSIRVLTGSGPRCNLYALVHKLCDHARTAGYEPVVMFTSVHGEANMGGLTDMTEDDYYTYGLEYYRDCQKLAAQAMAQPDYRAPIVMHFPVQMVDDDSRQIHNAILRISRDLQNCILTTSINQWQCNGDAIHNSAAAYRQRGEWDGYLLRKFFQDGKTSASPKPVNCVRSGTTVTLTFDQEVALEASLGLGTTLNVANAFYGLEYVDNGSYIPITAVVINGRTLTITINALPVGAANTQFLHIGMQANTGIWPGGICGAPLIAANDPGEPSIHDPTKRFYHYVVPNKIAVR